MAGNRRLTPARPATMAVSPRGFWLLLGEQTLFLAFAQFPWFREFTLRERRQDQTSDIFDRTKWEVFSR